MSHVAPLIQEITQYKTFIELTILIHIVEIHREKVAKNLLLES